MPDACCECLVPGCAEPVQFAGGASPYCAWHANLVWTFHQWLAGSGPLAVLCFDRDRARLEHFGSRGVV